MTNCSEGNLELALRLIMRKYQSRLYQHIRRMVIDHDESDDLMQTTFIKVWENLSKFRNDASLYTWIYRIATNECLNHLSKKRKRFFIPIHDISGELESKLIAEASNSAHQIEVKLQKALLSLPDKQRLVFNMRYYEDIKYEEMAQILNTSVGALKASYHHAYKKVEKIIEQL